MCELVEVKDQDGKVVDYRQGLSLHMDCFGRCIYCRNFGQWAVGATIDDLTMQIKDCNLDMMVTQAEFENKTGKSFFSVCI